MALSNWDMYAVTHEGNASDGTFTSPSGVSVSIYKNWLYVRDPVAWRDHQCFSQPTVMEIQHGEVRYLDVRIYARRGPQNGIYCVVASGYGKDLTGMAGIGCYGYKDSEWIGVTPRSVVFLQRLVKSNRHDIWQLRELDVTKGVRYNQGDAYFASVAGVPVPATDPGQAEPTVMSKLLDQWGAL